jgi:hypothetical protein
MLTAQNGFPPASYTMLACERPYQNAQLSLLMKLIACWKLAVSRFCFVK